MASIIDGNNCYYDGRDFIRKGNYIGARSCFQTCYQESGGFRRESLLELINIDLIEGKYKDARERLNLFKNGNDPAANIFLGKLEKLEYNYNRSIFAYEKALNYQGTQLKGMLGLAHTYTQLGEYGVVKPILEATKRNKKGKIPSIFNQVAIAILTGNYEQAGQFLNEINPGDLNGTGLSKEYTNMLKLVSYYTKELRNEAGLSPIDNYFAYSLFDDSSFLSHVKRHLAQGSKKDGGIFFKDLDFKTLCYEAKNMTDIIIPNILGVVYTYTIPFDNPIGTIASKATNAIVLTTHFNGKYLTWYPTQLSDECDQEGYSYNKGLLLKRSQGGY